MNEIFGGELSLTKVPGLDITILSAMPSVNGPFNRSRHARRS